MKKLIYLLFCFLLIGCSQQASPEETIDQEVTENIDNEQEEMKQADEITEVNVKMFDEPVSLDEEMRISDVVVDGLRKQKILEWLNLFEPRNFSEYEGYLCMVDGIVIMNNNPSSPFGVMAETLTIGHTQIQFINLKDKIILTGLDQPYAISAEYYGESPIQLDLLIYDSLGSFFKGSLEIPEISSTTKQYMRNNLPNITQDLIFADLNSQTAAMKNDALRQFLARLENQLNHFDPLDRLLAVVDRYIPIPLNQKKPSSYTDTFQINNQTITLAHEIYPYSRYYPANELKQLYFTVYGEEMDLSAYSEYKDGNIYYDSNADFVFDTKENSSSYSDFSQLYVINQSISNQQLILDIAAIPTHYLNDGKIRIDKNSGLPIQWWHFSEESRSDGIYKLSEIIQDQPNQFDTYHVIADIEEDGSYSLVSIQQSNPAFIPDGDIIFYNNYEITNDTFLFMPLFNCSLCDDFNKSILEIYFFREADAVLSLYEDERIAAVFVERPDYGGTMLYELFAYDKLNQQLWPELSDEEAQPYLEILRKDNPTLSDDIHIQKFEIMDKTLLQIYGEGIRNHIIEINDSHS